MRHGPEFIDHTTELGSLERVYKSEESKVQTVEKIHALYRELAGLKEKMFITGSKFDKLAKVKGMCND